MEEIILAGLIGLSAALIGGWLSGHYALKGVETAGTAARELAADEAGRRDAAEQRALVRGRDLLAIDETRRVLVGQLSWLERRVVLGDVRAASPEIDNLTRYNINLLADADLIDRYGAVVVELQEGLPMTAVQGLAEVFRNVMPRSLDDMDVDMIQRTSMIRAELLAALDRQEERVMNDQPLARLSAAELETVAPAAAMADALRERQSAHRMAPDL